VQFRLEQVTLFDLFALFAAKVEIAENLVALMEQAMGCSNNHLQLGCEIDVPTHPVALWQTGSRLPLGAGDHGSDMPYALDTLHLHIF
jgi:hypothetical protein